MFSRRDMARLASGAVQVSLAAWRYISRWVVLSIAVGVLAGAGAAAFQAFLRLCTSVLLGGLVHHHPATVAADGGAYPPDGFSPTWAVGLVVAGGAFVGTLLVRWLAPEAAGHGTDAAIRAIHHDPSGTPARTGVLKLFAAGITIGSGGSGGSEGPTAQITAALASVLSRRLKLPFDRAQTVVAIGLGAGVGAIFRTPIAGAVFGAEVIYRRYLAVRFLVPGAIASTSAYLTFGVLIGFDPIFGVVDVSGWAGRSLLAYPLIGVVAGLVGRLYAATFRFTSALFAKPIRWLPLLVRPAAAGAVTGLLGLAVPGVIGTGYGTAQMFLAATPVLAASIWLLAVTPLTKIVATSLSIGSGGSGGIFGPGLVIGAGLGALVWRVLPAAFVPASPAAYVIAAMAACVGAIARAPIALVIMVAEATQNVWMIVPAAIATAVAYLVVGRQTLYQSQLDRPSGSTAVTSAPVPLREPPGSAVVLEGDPVDLLELPSDERTYRPRDHQAR